MEFSPYNHVVKLFLQGMSLEEKGNFEEAGKLFLKGWNEAKIDFEKFLAAFYIAKHQKTVSDRLHWFNNALQIALNLNDNTVKSAFSNLYSNIAKCYEDLNDNAKAKEYTDLSISFKYNVSDEGPFYHGTKADLKIGDLLIAGGNSNYKLEFKMNHIYFTALIAGAGLAAQLANGNEEPRVYVVEPTGSFENDPNVTDKKFPGNPTRSYRSKDPLKIIGEITDWVRLPSAEIENWKERLANSKGEIIN